MPGVRAGPRSILWGCKLSVIGGTAADGNTALTAAGMLMETRKMATYHYIPAEKRKDVMVELNIIRPFTKYVVSFSHRSLDDKSLMRIYYSDSYLNLFFASQKLMGKKDNDELRSIIQDIEQWENYPTELMIREDAFAGLIYQDSDGNVKEINMSWWKGEPDNYVQVMNRIAALIRSLIDHGPGDVWKSDEKAERHFWAYTFR